MKIKIKAECAQCGEMVGAAQARDHLISCSLQHMLPSRSMSEGYLIRISSVEHPDMYWMFVTIPIDAPLKLLDAFLRETWLECCGHLSEFVMGIRNIFSCTESGNPTRAMNNHVGNLLLPGATCRYVYDMGSSTELTIQVIEKINACPQQTVTLLMQNEPPVLPCEFCKKVAKVICSLCGDTICSARSNCGKRHPCVVKERNNYMLMPLVNSPRAGVCGYVGTQSEGAWPSSE